MIFIGVFIRSNLFQGSWNFERMQVLGFASPAVAAIVNARISKTAEARRRGQLSVTEFFNTHPYAQQFVLGVTRWANGKRRCERG